jgi:AraC-like DNA-binding protein
MDSDIEKAVLRSVETMHENLGEPITIDDLARAAIFSKFHFSRVFQRVTGLSPGRFLSALRIQEAKRLLVSTSTAVTEISHQVGYSSVGTFSTRFKNSVGVSPVAYRQSRRVTPEFTSLPTAGEGCVIRGDISAPVGDAPVFVGVFPDRIQEGIPARCTVLPRPGPFVLDDVPPGTWHLLVQSTARGDDAAQPDGGESFCIGGHGPIEVGAGRQDSQAAIRLRARSVLDPPVLLALCDLRSLAPA